MRIIATYVLHYGAEYLRESILSVLPYVDEVAVWYTPVPSFGHGTTASLPEGEEATRLHRIANSAAGVKLTWVTMSPTKPLPNETSHRNLALSYAKMNQYDAMVAVDADEVWQPEAFDEVRFLAGKNKARYRVPMVHLWQGFDLACYDNCQPVRIYVPKADSGEGEADIPSVYHFGYAIGDELMKYKWEIHGHKNELREDWYEKKWLARAREDVHPTNVNFWNAVPFDRERLPQVMRSHPRWNER